MHAPHMAAASSSPSPPPLPPPPPPILPGPLGWTKCFGTPEHLISPPPEFFGSSGSWRLCGQPPELFSPLCSSSNLSPEHGYVCEVKIDDVLVIRTGNNDIDSLSTLISDLLIAPDRLKPFDDAKLVHLNAFPVWWVELVEV